MRELVTVQKDNLVYFVGSSMVLPYKLFAISFMQFFSKELLNEALRAAVCSM